MTHKVLIVEDEPNIAAALRFLLTHDGFDVGLETDGARVHDRISEMDPALVILDIMLPNRSGLDILRDLQDRPGAPPVLMLTAKGQAKDRKTAEALGATRFITKPFSNGEVVDAVRELTGAAQLTK